jgi:hypothetical protein
MVKKLGSGYYGLVGPVTVSDQIREVVAEAFRSVMALPVEKIRADVAPVKDPSKPRSPRSRTAGSAR